MTRLPLRSLVRRGAAIVFVTSAVGIAHAASLGGVSDGTLAAWSYPTDIVVEDATPPTITAAISPAANVFGWHNTALTVTFTCDDEASGVASCTDPVTISGEGAGQLVVGDAVDNAGNAATTTVTLDVDLTGPVVEIVGVDDGGVLPVAPTATCTATDALSGVVGSCVVTVSPGPDGQFVVTATAVDYADNVTVETAEYWVLTICGVGPPNVPCVIPYGTVFEGDLEWNADVLVLGEVTKKIDVLDGSVTVGTTGVVGDDITQTGTGGVTVFAGGFVDGKVEESGTGSVVIDGEVTDNVREEDEGDLVIGPNGYVDGSVKEFGAGSLIVAGIVEKDVEEEGDGDLTVGGTGTVVDGKVKETGAGSLFVDGEVHDDVEESGDGDVTIGANADVDGKVKETGAGSVYVNGVAGDPSVIGDDIREEDEGDLVIGVDATVNGNVKETGLGSLTVDGLVTGDIAEEGDGDLTTGPASIVNGDAKEKGSGSVIVSGTVLDDVVEEDDGDLTLASTANVGKNAKESGPGSVFVSGTVVKSVEEKGIGHLDVLAGASIGEDAVEDDAGNLTVTGPSTIGDEVKESKDGDLTVNALAVAAVADSTGGGTCTISPLATVPVRKGSCA